MLKTVWFAQSLRSDTHCIPGPYEVTPFWCCILQYYSRKLQVCRKGMHFLEGELSSLERTGSTAMKTAAEESTGWGQASGGTTPSAPTHDGGVPLVPLGLEDQVIAPRWSLQHKESCMSPRVGGDSLYIGDQHGMKIINLGLGTIC